MASQKGNKDLMTCAFPVELLLNELVIGFKFYSQIGFELMSVLVSKTPIWIGDYERYAWISQESLSHDERFSWHIVTLHVAVDITKRSSCTNSNTVRIIIQRICSTRNICTNWKENWLWKEETSRINNTGVSIHKGEANENERRLLCCSLFPQISVNGHATKREVVNRKVMEYIQTNARGESKMHF